MVFTRGLRHELAAVCVNTACHVFAFLFCGDDFQPVGDGVVDQQTAMVEATLRLATDPRSNWLYLDVALELRLAAGVYDIAVMTGDWVSKSRQLGLGHL